MSNTSLQVAPRADFGVTDLEPVWSGNPGLILECGAGRTEQITHTPVAERGFSVSNASTYSVPGTADPPPFRQTDRFCVHSGFKG